MTRFPVCVRMLALLFVAAMCGQWAPSLVADEKADAASRRLTDAVFGVIWTGDHEGSKNPGDNTQIETLLNQIRGAGYQAHLMTYDVDRHDLAAYDVIVLPSSWDSWTSVNRAKADILDTRGDEFHAYMKAGGAVWMLQPNPYLREQSRCTPAIAPYPITFQNSFQQTDKREIKNADHAIVKGKTDTADWLPQHFDTVEEYDEHWSVIVACDGHPSVMEAVLGDGVCLATPAAPTKFSDEFSKRVCRYLVDRGKAPLALANDASDLPAAIDEDPASAVRQLAAGEAVRSRRECEAALIAKGADALTAIGAVVQGGSSPAVDLEELRPLLNDLNSREYAVRQNAHLRLARLGHLVMPLLREGAESRNPEVAYRCQVLISRLVQQSQPALLSEEMETASDRSLVRVLSQIDDPGAVELLKRLTQNDSLLIARLASQALAEGE